MTGVFALVLLCGVWSISGSQDSADPITSTDVTVTMPDARPLRPSQVDVAIGEVTPTTVTMLCTLPIAEVDDNTKFRVEYDSRMITISAHDHDASTEIRIENLRPATSYTFRVQARNVAHGLSGPSTDVTVTTPDIRPTLPLQVGVAIGEVTPTTVTLICTLPIAEVDDNTKFSVEYDSRMITISACYHEASVEIRIENLRPVTSYTFRVRASNAYGMGNTSTDVTVTTPDARPTLPSQVNVAIEEVTPTTVTMLCTLPIAEVDDVTKFIVEYDDQILAISACYHTATAEIRIENLRPATSYTFRVGASNAYGIGDTSTDVTVTTPDARPSRPSQVDVAIGEVTPTTVTLICTLPLAEVDDNTEFSVRYNRMITRISAHDHETPTEIRIENLRPATSYTFRVQARNAAHALTGPSNDVTVTTLDIQVY